MINTTSNFVDTFFHNKKGKFLEIGSEDANPAGLEEPFWNLLLDDWHGVYVEPNPHSLEKLITNVTPYHADVIAAAWSDKSQILPFYASSTHPYCSSFDEEWNIKYIPEGNRHIKYHADKIYVSTITADQIFNKFGYDFAAISIDIELPADASFKLLQTIDFNKLPKCTLVILEMINDEIKTFMSSNGFTCTLVGDAYKNWAWTR